MKKVLKKILSLAMVGTMTIANCPTMSANAQSSSSGHGVQSESIVVHTPEEFFEAFEDDTNYTYVYVADDLDFSSYDNFEAIDDVGACNIIGYDEDTGEEVQRTFSNITYTTSGLLRDTLGSNCDQSEYNLGFINTYGGIKNINFEDVNVTLECSYVRGNGIAYPHFNVMSACGYENVSVHDLTINATGYFEILNVLGDSWNLYSENNIIVDGVTVNGGDIQVFNVLAYSTKNMKNVDVRNIEINADELYWFETVNNAGRQSLDDTVENVTVSDITINNDISGFAGIAYDVYANLNNCAVQNININGSVKSVYSLGFQYSDYMFSNFLVRNINADALIGECLFGGVTAGVWFSSSTASQEDVGFTSTVANGYIDVQSPYFKGLYTGGLINQSAYDPTGSGILIGDNIYSTTDTPVVGFNQEYSNIDDFNTILVEDQSVEEIYENLHQYSNAWTIKDGQIDILPWYELPQDSVDSTLLRIKKYILGIVTTFDESLDLNDDGKIDILDYLIALS